MKLFKKLSQNSVIYFIVFGLVLFISSLVVISGIKQARAAVSTTIVISEVQVEGAGGTTEEFVELYNMTASPISIAGWDIGYAAPGVANLSSWTAKATLPAGASIPAYGFYLIASSGFQPFGMVPDYSATTAMGFDDAGGFIAFRNASDTVIDYVGYGVVTDPTLCEGGTTCAVDPGTGSIERKALVSSTATTMNYGGADEWYGNGYDTDQNSTDFVLRISSNPQKSTFGSESANFMIMNVMPLGPTMVSVMFNKPIKTATALVGVATLSTADPTDDETVTSVEVLNNMELKIYATGANINASTGADNITISSALTDDSDSANTITTAQTIQMFVPPEVMGVQVLSDNAIKIYFSKAMEKIPTELNTAYAVNVNGSVVDITTGTTLALNTGGDSTELTITKTGAFANLANAGSDYVTPAYNSSSPMDTQGNALQPTFGWQRDFALDGTKPTVTGGSFDATAKTVTLYFSEDLKTCFSGCAAVTASNYVFSPTSACTGTKTANFLQNTTGLPSYNTVVISCATAVDIGSGFTVTANATNVIDQAGNAVDATGSANVYTASTAGNASIKIASIAGNPSLGSDNMMIDGCTNTYGSTGNYLGNGCTANATANRDTLTITFTGSINPSSIGYDSTNSIAYNIGSYLEVYKEYSRGSGSETSCNSWEYLEAGYCLNKESGNLGSSFGVLSQTTVANDTLTIYLQGTDVNVSTGMEFKPNGIMGMNGQAAAQSVTDSNNQFAMIFAKVSKVIASGLTASNTITMFFSLPMNTSTITNVTTLNNILKPSQYTPFLQQHTFGVTGAAVAWGDASGNACNTSSPSTNNCLKITLGAETTVANNDMIEVQGILRSSSGFQLGWGGNINTTVLALSNYIWKSSDNSLILEFNKMLRDVNTFGPPDFANNTITPSGLTITAKEPIFDTTGSGMEMFKKIKLTFDSAMVDTDSFNFSVSGIEDENGNVVPNISVVAASPTGNQVAPTSDLVGPILAQVVTKDLNYNGALDGGDELTFKFDNEAVNTDSAYVSDVDQTTWNNVNTEFIVKRDSLPLTNAFGDWAGYWVDMWGDFAGQVHINLGAGANIQADDEIWATGTNLRDFAGNPMDTSSALATIQETRAVEISKIIYTDNGTAGINNTDTFVITFSGPIDPTTLGAYTVGGSPEVSNIDWGLGVQFNWESGMGGTYNAATAKTWGDAVGAWSSNFTVLTITLAGGNASVADGDMIVPYSVQSIDGAWVNMPGFIDLSSPSLTQVLGDKTLGSSPTAWDAGDTLTFLFSEGMAPATLTTATMATLATELGIADLFGAGSATWLGLENNVLAVTLGAGANIADGTTFNPIAGVTDKNGNADNTSPAVSITIQTVKPVSSIVLADSDLLNPGIDGRDLTITWTAPTGSDSSYSYDIYILPDFVYFDPDVNGIFAAGENTHFPIANVNDATVCSASSCTYAGIAGLMTDSRTAVSTSTGASQSGAFYYPLSDQEPYRVYVVAIDGSSNRSFAQQSLATTYLTMEYGASFDNSAPWIEGTMPFDGAIVPINNKTLTVNFSEPMNSSSVETSGNIIVQQCTASDCSAENNWSNISQTVYVTYSSNPPKADIEVLNNFDVNTKYRLRITSTGVTDNSGNYLASTFDSYFRTSSASDSTSPQVAGNSFAFEGKTLTAIDRTEPMLGIAFNEDMDASSFTATAVTLSPEVPGSSFFYDSGMMGLAYYFGSALAQNTQYTLTLSGIYIKDIAGNTLDGDQNGTGAGTTADNYTLTFTTANTALNTTTKAVIPWIYSSGDFINLGFDLDMRTSTVEDSSNWTLTQGSTIISLQAARFKYDGFKKELRVSPVNLTPGTAYTITPSTAVLSMSGTIVNTASSSLNFTPESDKVTFSGGSFGDDMYATGGIFGDGGMFDSSNMTAFDGIMNNVAGGGTHTGSFDPAMAGKIYLDDAYNDFDVKTFTPIEAQPMNQIEGQSSSYSFGLPITKAIPHGGKIVIDFPVGFTVTSAIMALDSYMPNTPLFYANQDLNGPGATVNENGLTVYTGKVQVDQGNIVINNMTNTIELPILIEDATGCTLTSGGVFSANCTNTSVAGTNKTMPFDYLNFEISGIINGSASEIDWQTNTGGYQVEMSTYDDNGLLLEGPVKSMNFSIKAAGAGAISGTVTAQDGLTPVANATVWGYGPAGPINTVTDATGAWSFSGLPLATTGNTYEGWYDINVESPKNDDAYFGGDYFRVQLTQASPTSTGNNTRLSTAANNLTITVTTGGVETDVMVSISGPDGYNEKQFTLDAVDDVGGTAGVQNNLIMKAADGSYTVSINEFYPMNMNAMGPSPAQSFMPPMPTQIEISGDTAVSISLTSAGYEINGAVLDASTSNGLANVNVEAWSPFDKMMPIMTQTNTDGSFSLQVPDGTYQIKASMPGLPPMTGKTVVVSGANVDSVIISASKPSRKISGTVSDGTNGLQYVGVNAWNDEGQYVFAETNANGEYVLYVDPASTWDVEVFAPGYGKLSPASGVTATNIDTTSVDVADIDFSTANSNLVTITGQITDASGNPVADIEVRAEEVDYSEGLVGDMTGNLNSTKTSADGSYSLTVPASTAGTGATATRYEINARSDDSGELTPLTEIDASSTVAGQDLSQQTIRILSFDIQNSPLNDLINPDASTPSDYMGEAYVVVNSPTANKGNEKKLTDGDLSDTADGSMNIAEASGYRAYLHISGLGEFEATENGGAGGSGFSVSGADKTLHFDLQRNSTTITLLTVSGTVTGGGNNLENAWVSFINESTFETTGTTTASNGTYSKKLPNLNPDGTTASWKVIVSKPGYTSPAAVKGITSTTAGTDFVMTANSSTVAGIIYSSDGTTPKSDVMVVAKEKNGQGFVTAVTDSNGTYSLDLAPSKTWNIVGKSIDGYEGQQLSVASGDASVDITLATQIDVASSGNLATTPKVQAITATLPTTIDDSDNSGVKMTIPAGTFGDSSTPGGTQVQIRETAAMPDTPSFEILGGTGFAVTSDTAPEKDFGLDFTYTKSEMETMTSTTASANNLDQMNEMKVVYFNEAANNYEAMSTSRTAEVKTSSSDTVWTPVDWDTFVDNVDNSDGDGSKDNYYDYQVKLTTSADHLTIFGVITGTDSVVPGAPVAPSGLAITSGSGTGVLSWTANTEADLMEYEVYRGTSSGVTVSNDNQINTTQVATNSFTDSTATDWTSYYYVITAADDSNNESSGSTEIRACVYSNFSNGTVANDCSITCDTGYMQSGNNCTPQGGGGGGGGGAPVQTTYQTYDPTTGETTIDGQVVAKGEAATTKTATTGEMPAEIDTTAANWSDPALVKATIAFEKSMATKVDAKLSNRLKGNILLQVEANGEAWYVRPSDAKKYYLGRPADAYSIMRFLSVGITNADLARLQTDRSFANKHAGKIFIQVEKNGEAYYVDFNGGVTYMKDGAAAYNILRDKGLGITNSNIRTIAVGETDENGIVGEVKGTKIEVSKSTVEKSVIENSSTASTGYSFKAFMSLGDVGGEVRPLQKLLQSLGYFPADQTITGYYGPLTEEAVISFQKANNIDSLGIVGPSTRRVLNSY